MKAMVLAAGIGSRLGALTEHKPKCLVEVGGRTLLELVIERLKAAGVTSVVINLHHFPDQIEAFVGERKNFGIEVRFTREQELLDTGGGILNARRYLEGENDFLVHNSDVYTEADLSELLAFHEKHRPLASLLIQRRETKRYLVFDSERLLLGRQIGAGEQEIVRRASVEDLYAFGGIHVVSSRIFEYLEPLGPVSSIIAAYLRAVEAGEQVRGFPADEVYWIDAGTQERIAELEKRLLGK